jgi:predicted alpha/beta hydrolase family esterase
MPTTFIVPGLKSSGPTHWQTWLEHRTAGAVRINQRDWNDPHLPDWSSRVRREIVRATAPVFIAAHSFGALAAVQAASDHAERVAGVLLVAPADPEHFGVAEYLPAQPLGFPAILVASSNDPWMPLDRAKYWAGRWGVDLVNIGAAGPHQRRIRIWALAAGVGATRAIAPCIRVPLGLRATGCVQPVSRPAFAPAHSALRAGATSALQVRCVRR